jgi:RHS repeat-associated protein
MKVRDHTFLVIALLVCVASRSSAQSQHANQSRGFDANGVYSTKDIDNINLFNGSLVITIPIGGVYPVGGGLSYSLTLIYNSNLWNHKEICPVQTTGYYTTWAHFGSQGELLWSEQPYPNGNDGEIITPRDSSSDCFTIAEPNPEANAGMGWQLTLGKLFPPRFNEGDTNPLATERQNWVYVSPDGGEHSFYVRLHQGDAVESGDGNQITDPVTYSRDSSYLRMKISGSERLIEFSNGQVHHFSDFGPPGKPDWRLTKMRDQFSNFVNVAYGDVDFNGAADWVLTDSVGRRQTIYFGKPAPDYQPVITRVELTAFDPTPAITSDNVPANYFFGYQTTEIKRAAPHVPDFPAYPQLATVPFLTSVTLPDGSQFGMPLVPNNPSFSSSYDLDGSQSSVRSRGIIRGVSLPTGGRVEWEYKGADIPTTDVDGAALRYGYPVASSARAYRRGSIGVRRRKVFEGTNIYFWSYDPKPEKQPTTSDDPDCTFQSILAKCAPKEFVNKVTTPEGNYSLHYFSFYPLPAFSEVGRSLTAWHIADYGLPITKYAAKTINDTRSKPLFLSEQVFEKSGTSYNLVRSEYRRYETDTVPVNDGYGSIVETNRRLVAQRTVYNDDNKSGAEKFAETQYSEFDGLGHYRRVETYGNFNLDAAGNPKPDNQRLERTNYNPGRGTYLIDPTTNQPDTSQPVPYGHSYQSFPIANTWVLGTYDLITQIENGLTSRAFFNFSSTGQLLRKRLLKSTGSNPGVDTHDVVVRYVYTNGNLTSEQYHGGEYQTLDTVQSLGVMPLPAPEYRIDHTYQFGSLQTSQYKTDTGANLPEANYKLEDRDIDVGTGLARTVRDIAKSPVTYVYDLMGRLTDIQPRDGGWTRVQYIPSDGTSQPKVILTQKTNGGVTLLDQEEYVYNQLGRVQVERKQMPGGSFIERTTSYNGSGWTTSVSEWGNSNKKTQYDLFDAFGRPQKIIPTDGSSHTTWLTYEGVRQVKRTVKVATSSTAEEDVDTIERYDRHGRLSSVEEYSDYATATPRTVTTFYTYDVGNRLTKVSTTANGITQTRQLTYDNRGFLVSETHPELGAGGNGTVYNLDYDSQGHLRLRRDGNNTVRFNYDRAERLTQVQECLFGGMCSIFNPGDWRMLKEYNYYTDDASASNVYHLGKLKQSIRHNWITNPYTGSPVDVSVTRTDEYAGPDGLLSQRITSTSTGAQFQQNYTYDSLGNIATQSYPQCVNSNCVNSSAAVPRTLTYTYQKGLLTKVVNGTTNYAKSITYSANGTLSTVAHGVTGNSTDNGVVDTQVMDLNYMQRPRQLYTSGAISNWDSGIYSFDGSGNVKRVGTDWYVYDRVNRIVEGTAIASTVSSQKRKQRYTYDAFGNVKTKETYGNVGTPSETKTSTTIFNINSATNRLSDMFYDYSGNMLGPPSANPQPYSFDAMNMMKTSPGKTYVYDADDERVLISDSSSGNPAAFVDTFVIRGLGNEVLREYTIYGGDGVGHWYWTKDYIYMGGRLLSSEDPSGRLNYHLDHLGSPRLITNNAKQVVSSHQYLPFGEEATSGGGGRLKFTGHERDQNYAPGQDLDYMHARHYSFTDARFLSVDPGRDFNPKVPQSWNLYAYVRNNPVNHVDVDGRFMGLAAIAYNIGVTLQQYQEMSDLANSILRPTRLAEGWLAPPYSLSARGYAFLKQEEGFRSKLYHDSAGHCTIGYGTLVHQGACTAADYAKYPKGISKADAEVLLQARVAQFEAKINASLKVLLNQNQFDALVSFVYNIGPGKKGYGGSTLLKYLNQGYMNTVPLELRRWKYADGKPKLLPRRNREGTLFTDTP